MTRRTHRIAIAVSSDELVQIRKAAALCGVGHRGLSAHIRERASTVNISTGLEALAVREDAKEALRELLETREAVESAGLEVGLRQPVTGEATAAWYRYVAARGAYNAARAKAREVAK